MPARPLDERRTPMCDAVGEDAAHQRAARAVSGNELPSAGGVLPRRLGADPGSEGYRRQPAKLERQETVIAALAQPLLPIHL